MTSQRLKTKLVIVFVFLITILGCNSKSEKKPLNILFIMVDDQNDMLKALGDVSAHTPNMDRLAAQSTVFTKAYCSAPACGPSRASLLAGLLPSTTGIYYNSQPNKNGTSTSLSAVMMPEHFKKNGYLIGIYGKLFHETNRSEHYRAMCADGYFSPHTGFWANIPDTSIVQLTDFRFEGGSNFAWAAVPNNWENETHRLIDTENTDKLIDALQKEHDAPFFLTLGFLRPHLPWIVPQRFFDLFPIESIGLPKGYSENDLVDLPECAKWMAKEVPGNRIGDGNVHDAILAANKWKEAIQAYKASTAYMDEQLGRILTALENSTYSENTVIIIASDHGYHVGEKEHWTKFGLWEKANHIPLMISLPNRKAQKVTSPVSLLDIYPTLVSIAGIDSPTEQQLEGTDLLPLINDPDMKRGRPVLSTYGYKNHSLRSDDFRYIVYQNGEEELYDHSMDPYELNNLAKDSTYKDVKKELQQYLPIINNGAGIRDTGLGWVDEVFEAGYRYQKN